MSSTNNATKDQAIALLCQGLSTSQIAAACGVSDSYISQLRAEPEVAAKVAASQADLTIADMQFDSRLERAESLALERIEKSIGFANMGQALAAFRILNGAKKRKEHLPGTDSPGLTVNVNLMLPASSVPRYVTNSANEIIEVEGKTMVSATPKSLDKILLERAEKAGNLPAVTHVEKAAAKLETLRPPAFRTPRTLPSALRNLSVDVL